MYGTCQNSLNFSFSSDWIDLHIVGVHIEIEIESYINGCTGLFFVNFSILFYFSISKIELEYDDDEKRTYFLIIIFIK